MQKLIRDRKEFPECVRSFKQLKGICIGGCVDPKFDLKIYGGAHAHCYKEHAPYRGWICLNNEFSLEDKFVLLHEVAHLIANKSHVTPAHGKAWRKVVVEIGGTFKSFSGKYVEYPDLSHSDPKR